MIEDLKNKVVLISGASTGIGAAAAVAFGRNGAKVAVHYKPQMLESFKASISMSRLGSADECAGAFLFLASEQMSGYMTGQILEVNGGQYMP